MTVTYRLAAQSDADELGRLHVAIWQSAYRGLMPDGSLDALDPAERAQVFREELAAGAQAQRGVTWIVAEHDGELVGHAMSHYTDGEAWLERLYLSDAVIGQGVGHTLHDMMLRALHRQGAHEAKLLVLAGNNRAIAFYEHHGWKESGVVTNADWAGIPVTAHEMHLPLNIDVLTANRTYWDAKAPHYAEIQTWDDEVTWGIFGIPDAAADRAGVGIFPDVDGLDVVELGCGNGYVSKRALQRGARSATGIDNSSQQLAVAQQRAAERGLALPLVMGDAQRLPFADASFDVAINEYGAAIWCDPHVWIPEAARVLRPGGLLWFLGNSVQAMLCMPEFEEEFATAAMRRPQRDMHRFEWLDTANVEYHVSHGEMISILTGAGFAIEALHELYATPDAQNDYGMMTAEWASQWPAEEVWVARLT